MILRFTKKYIDRKITTYFYFYNKLTAKGVPKLSVQHFTTENKAI